MGPSPEGGLSCRQHAHVLAVINTVAAASSMALLSVKWVESHLSFRFRLRAKLERKKVTAEKVFLRHRHHPSLLPAGGWEECVFLEAAEGPGRAQTFPSVCPVAMRPQRGS